MYWKRPTAAECAEGCKPEDYPEPTVQVWDENWPAIQLFSKFSTQWRMSAAGPAGLDYGVIQHELARKGLPDDQYDDLMDRLRVIEQAALGHIHSKGT